MTSQGVSEVEARFSSVRRNLDGGGYMESFGSDSLRLVEHLYNDLVTTTESLQKALAEFARYKLAEKGKETAQRQQLQQMIEVDFFVPQACPQCIRLRNYVEYGKNPERTPKTVDYIRLADSRIDALQIQLRSLKSREKDNMSLIVSLKNMIEMRDTEIDKLRDSLKHRSGCIGDFDGKGYEVELKAAEMKMQILQLRNLELEDKLKKSIFEEHENYMLGKIPPYLSDKSLVSICIDKELDRYPSHDKMTLLEKMYYLEQQLSHCCKEKAILQNKIDECRLKHQTPTKIYASRVTKSQSNKVASVDKTGAQMVERNKPTTTTNKKISFHASAQSRTGVKPAGQAKANHAIISRKSTSEQGKGHQRTKSLELISGNASKNFNENGDQEGASEISSHGSGDSNGEEEFIDLDGEYAENTYKSSKPPGLIKLPNATNRRKELPIKSSKGQHNMSQSNRKSSSTDAISTIKDIAKAKHSSNRSTSIATHSRKPSNSNQQQTSNNMKQKRVSNTTDNVLENADQSDEEDHLSEADAHDSVEYSSYEEEDDEEVHPNKNASDEYNNETGYGLENSEDGEEHTESQSKKKLPIEAINQGKHRHQSSSKKRVGPIDHIETTKSRSQSTSGSKNAQKKGVSKDSRQHPSNSNNVKTSSTSKSVASREEGSRPGRSIKVSASKKESGKVMPSVITTPANVEDYGEAVDADEVINYKRQIPETSLITQVGKDGRTPQQDYSQPNENLDDTYEEVDFSDEGGEEEEEPSSKSYNQKNATSQSQSRHLSTNPSVSSINQQAIPQHTRYTKHTRMQIPKATEPIKHASKKVGFNKTTANSKSMENRGASMERERLTGDSSNQFSSNGHGDDMISRDSDENYNIPRNPVGRTNANRQSRETVDRNRVDSSYQQQPGKGTRRSQDTQIKNSRRSMSDTRINPQTATEEKNKLAAARGQYGKSLDAQIHQSQPTDYFEEEDFPVPLGHASQSQVSFSEISQGISAVKEPSLLSISEFEKDKSEYAPFVNEDESLRIRNRDKNRIHLQSSNAASINRGGSLNPVLSEDGNQGFPDTMSGKYSYDPYRQVIKDGHHVVGFERNMSGWSEGEFRDKEFGRGKGYGSDTATASTATGYSQYSDTSQMRRGAGPKNVPFRSRDSRVPTHRGSSMEDDRHTFKKNIGGRIEEEGVSLRSVAINTEESVCFGLPWDERSSDPFENKQLADKVTTLQRKIDDLQAESSRHQLKSFELQGELERTRHMLQVEKQERELAVSELKRIRDRNSETSARLLLNSSMESDIFRRGATPMEMEREISNLRAALASLDRDKDEMRVELDRKDEKLAKVIHESSQYEDEISQLKLRLKNAELQISHTGESAKEQSREGDFLKKQLENTRRDLEKILRERDDALKELHKISAAHSKTQADRRGVESELELKCKEADDLRKQVQRYIDEVRRIEELLLDKEEEMEMLIQHYRALTVENTSLETQRTNLEKEASSIRDSVKDAVHQNISFKTQLSSQNALVQSLEEEIQRFTEQVSQLENQLSSKQEKEQALEQDVKASKDLLYRMEVQMDKQKLDLADAESKRKQLEVENSELTSHISSLEIRLQDETDRQSQLEVLVANSREKEFQNQNTASNISRERDELADQLTSLQQRSESLNSEVSRYRLKSIELQNELDRTRRQLDSEKRDRESAISELKRAREQLHSSSANYLLKSALGSSGLASESSPGSGSEIRPNITGTLAEGSPMQRSSREQSPFIGTRVPLDSQPETPPNATSTSRRDQELTEGTPSSAEA